MKFFQILFENRVDDFISKYQNKFSDDQRNEIIKNFPNKNLNWVGKNIEPLNFKEKFGLLSWAIKEFEKISSNLPKTDLNTYESLDELVNALTEYSNKERRQYQEFPGGNIVYQDDRFFVVNPQTIESSCYYGKGTKWCTSSGIRGEFNRYNQDGKLFYILDKKLKTDDPFYKVALLKKFEGDESFWDARDESFSKGWILDTDEFKKIRSSIDTYMESEFAEQLKIYRDKELKRKEEERQRQLRIRQRYLALEAEADERRNENEWALGPDTPEEGLKAWALLYFLESEQDIEVRTPVETAKISDLKLKIEQLNQQYENSEDVDTSILDEISELEDEVEELENKIDVYNIVPTGTFYDMTKFEVINSDVSNNSYAVGDDRELQDSAESYVDNLIDDIGYEGFSKSFVESHIDESKVVDEARDVFEEDINNNPDSYFQDDERELSSSQENDIAALENKIERTRMEIERLEQMSDPENEELQEKIDEKVQELNDLIDEMESEIEDIKNDPQGDFPQDLIDEKIEDMLYDVQRDPQRYLEDYGLNPHDYINKDEFIQDVIDTDGLGIINGYDGNYDSFKVNNITFNVMRID